MNIPALIEQVSVASPTGQLTITPYSQINVNKINGTKLWNTKSIHFDRTGPIFFKDNQWLSKRKNGRTINSEVGCSGFEYEIKAYAILKLNIGNYEGGSGLKDSTVALLVDDFRKFALFLKDKGFISFEEFNNAQSIKKRNILRQLLTNSTEYIDLNPIDKSSPYNKIKRVFDVGDNYHLLSENTCAIFYEELDKLAIPPTIVEKTLSHPVIPSGLLKIFLKKIGKHMENINLVMNQWEETNNAILEQMKRSIDTKVPGNYTSSKAIANLTNENFNSELGESFDIIKGLKVHTLVYILAFTGMRIEEALSCKIGCATERDGKFFIKATLTKTDESEIMMDWVTNQDTFDAVCLLERYIVGMRKRGELILEYNSHFISNTNLHNLKQGLIDNLLFGVNESLMSIKFTSQGLSNSKDKSKRGSFTFQNFNLTLSEDDVLQLEMMKCNYKAIKGHNRGIKYQTGDQLNLTPHMFRHTFAWFIIANRLGELDDIKYQYKHLTSAMTMTYTARGYASIDELINIFEDFEEQLVGHVAEEIAEQANNATLGGGGGERFIKGAKELIIGVTDSSNPDGKNNVVRQIHFKDLAS